MNALAVAAVLLLVGPANSSAPSVALAQGSPTQSTWRQVIEQPLEQRRAASHQLAQDDSYTGLVSLWLLAHDPDHQVVGAALEAALSRCRARPDDVCLASLYFFMDAEVEDSPDAWRARTTLLAEEPELARAYASRETKLDVVSLLAGKLTGGNRPNAWLSALQLLASDPEPDVQDAASAVLLQLER